MTCRKWLRENGYSDIADLIDQVMAEIEANGSKQRRNWWDVLAGGTNGKPIVVNGQTFPVLRVAQIFGLVPRNWLYGLRTPYTMASDDGGIRSRSLAGSPCWCGAWCDW